MDLLKRSGALKSEYEKQNESFQNGFDVAEFKPLFVAPAPSKLPEDGVFNYVVITSIYELNFVPARSCVLVAEDMFDAIQLATSHPEIFQVRVTCIQGLPGADYPATFDGAVWNTRKAGYNALVSEIRMVVEAEEAARAANQGIHDRERAQYTRSNGNVKDNTNFVLSDDAQGDDDE